MIRTLGKITALLRFAFALRPLTVRLITALLAAVTLAGCLAHHQGAMPGEPKAASFHVIDGVRVRYRDVGQGPVVVLIHGFASSLETWSLVEPELIKDHRLISLDLKGFGWTDRPEGDYSPDAQARIVLGLLDQLGIDKAAVVAHSWGCSVALALALRAPTRVTRLALYDAWAYDQQIPAFFRWAMVPGLGEALFALYYDERPEDRLVLAFFDPSRVPQKLLDDVVFSLKRPGTTAAALAAVRGERFAAMQGRYRQIAAPTLLLWGRQDGVALEEFAERLLRDMPDVRVRWFERCGHFPMLEAVAESNRALGQFLREGR